MLPTVRSIDEQSVCDIELGPDRNVRPWMAIEPGRYARAQVQVPYWIDCTGGSPAHRMPGGISVPACRRKHEVPRPPTLDILQRQRDNAQAVFADRQLGG